MHRRNVKKWHKVTIVTAFKDIGRESWKGIKNGEMIPSYIKRDAETYFQRFERLTRLDNKIVVYSEEKFRERFEKYPNVEFIDIDKDFLDKEKDHCQGIKRTVEYFQKRSEFVDFVERKSAPEYWSVDYVLINYLKSLFVLHYLVRSHKQGSLVPEESSVAWIDFGYCREDRDAPEGKRFFFDTEGKINVFMNGKIDEDKFMNHPVFDLIKTGEVLIQGSHVIAPANKWKTLSQEMHTSISSMLELGMVDDDQTLLLMSVRRNFKEFKVNLNDENDWFNVIRNNSI